MEWEKVKSAGDRERRQAAVYGTGDWTMAQLRIRTGKQRGTIIRIEGSAPICVGRDTQAKLQIIDKGISREHAEVFRVGEMVFVRDLNSRNGTYVNDERVEEELLREGDLIRIGATELVFESGTPEQKPANELKYDENELFHASLDLQVGDLLSLENGLGTHESDYFRALDRAVHILHGEQKEQKILERLSDLIMEVVPADHLYLFLREEKNDTVVPKATRRKGSAGGTVPVSRTILRRVITESRAILTADAMSDERFKAGDSIVMGQIRAVLCAPIQADAERTGALGAVYAVNVHMTEAFEEADLHFLSTLGMQLAYALEKMRSEQRRERTFFSTIGRLVTLLERERPNKAGYAEHVARFAAAIAEEMNQKPEEIETARLAALLHAVGVAPALSDKPALYQADEEKTPPAAADAARETCEMLGDLPDIGDRLALVWKALGERYDGTGTPKGLKGKAIPAAARVVAVAEAFARFLKADTGSLGQDEPDVTHVRHAFIELGNLAGEAYDTEAVRALTAAYRNGLLWPAGKETSDLGATDEETTGSLRAVSGKLPKQAQTSAAEDSDTAPSSSEQSSGDSDKDSEKVEDGTTESEIPKSKP